jgi:hypothetical protein
MAVVQRPPSQPAGPLWWVGWYLDSFKQWLEHVGNSVKDVFLLGQWLSYPFLSMAYYVGRAADYARNGDDRVQELLAWINGIVDGWLFIDLLFWVSAEYRSIRDNARLWVKIQLLGLNSWFYFLIIDPKAFVNLLIRQVAWYISLLLDDPKSFIVYFLKQVNWWLAWVIDTPKDFVLYFLRQANSLMGLLVDNPRQWFKDRLLEIAPHIYDLLYFPRNWTLARIRELFPYAYPLLSNPDGWLKSNVAQLLGLPSNFFSNPIGYILSAIFNKLQTEPGNYANLLSRLIIDLILHFI